VGESLHHWIVKRLRISSLKDRCNPGKGKEKGQKEGNEDHSHHATRQRLGKGPQGKDDISWTKKLKGPSRSKVFFE